MKTQIISNTNLTIATDWITFQVAHRKRWLMLKEGKPKPLLPELTALKTGIYTHRNNQKFLVILPDKFFDLIADQF